MLGWLLLVPDGAIVGVSCTLITARVLLSVTQQSATFDEPTHLTAGYVYLTTADYRLNPEHPPLAKLLAALPLSFTTVKPPATPTTWEATTQWMLAHQFVYQDNDADTLLLLACIGLLPLTLALGTCVFLWTRELFDRGAAVLALFLYSFDPNLLAHAGLVNTDVGASCFVFLTVFAFFRAFFPSPVATSGNGGGTGRGPSRPMWTRLLLTGVLLGLALLTKFSTLWLVPTLGILAVGVLVFPPSKRRADAPPLSHLSREREPSINARSPFDELRVSGKHSAETDQQPLRLSPSKPGLPVHRHLQRAGVLVVPGVLLAIGLMAYATIWAGYQFRYAAFAGDDSYRQLWNRTVAQPPLVHRVLQAGEQAHVLPEAYLAGLTQLFSNLRRYSFLNGEISTEGRWYYFPIAFALKTPLPFLILLAVALFALPYAVRRCGALAVAFILVPAAVYFTAAVLSPLNIGHRHLLPVYPFLCVWLGVLVPWMTKKAQGARRKAQGWTITASQIVLAVLGAWYLYASVSVHPHYLAYFNEVAGGPEHGYRHLVDSNLDWGQDLKGLKRYMREHGIKKVWLSYFGMASPEYHGIDYEYLPSHYILNPPHVDARLFKLAQLPPLHGSVAISATNLQGVYLPVLGFGKDYFAVYRERTPVAKIGNSIFVYRLDDASR